MPDPLDKSLARWKADFQPDRELAARVRAEVRSDGGYGQNRAMPIAVWIGNAFSRPGLAACFAAVFVLVGMGVSQLLNLGLDRQGEEATLSYRLSIDPLYRLQAMAGAQEFASQNLAPPTAATHAPPVLRVGLGWLKGELDLSQKQMTQVTRLHSEYESAFDELFGRLLESHRAYREFDRNRMDDDVIDYFGLYDLLQVQKQLSEESTQLTEELMEKVEQVISPSQRSRYRELLDTVYPKGSEDSIRTADV